MKWLSQLHKPVAYRSVYWRDSARYPGVKFAIRRISLGQRMELSARVRELTLRNEFLRAGEIQDHLEAEAADLLVQKLYIEWATVALNGLTIDGMQATIPLLIERGPEDLLQEIAGEIKAELRLTEGERKN